MFDGSVKGWPDDDYHKHTLPGQVKKKKKKTRLKKKRERLLKKKPNCYYCGCNLTKETATIDHIIPRSKGGTYRRDNIVLACQPCNTKKGNKILPKELNNDMAITSWTSVMRSNIWFSISRPNTWVSVMRPNTWVAIPQ